MVKNRLFVAVVVALCPLSALADISLYGRAHVSLDYLDNGAGYGGANVSSNASRFGIRAQHHIGSLTALAQIEQEINMAQGNGASWASRDTFVGIKGEPWGMLRVGRFDSPFKAARGPANLFGDQLGDMRNLTRVGDARFDERLPNSVHYQTPAWQGWQGNLAYSLHDGEEQAPEKKEDAYSLSLTYEQASLSAAVAYEFHNQNKSRGHRQGVRVALGAKVKDPLTLVAFYQYVNHKAEDADSHTYGLGTAFKVLPQTTMKAMYMYRAGEAKKDRADLIAVGVEHSISRPLRVYANYAVVLNDEESALTPWQQGRSTTVKGVVNENASGVSMGLRYDF